MTVLKYFDSATSSWKSILTGDNGISMATMLSYVDQLWNTRAGVLEPFAGPTPPAGSLLPYGQLVSRTTYAKLFAAIGTAYGSGDGVTTFALPDMRGRTAAGLDNMGGTDAGRLSWANTLGNAGGAQNLADHTHSINDSVSRAAAGVINGNIAWIGIYASNPLAYTTLSAYSHAPGNVAGTYGFNHHTPIYGSTYGTSVIEGMQPTMLVNWIIWTGERP